MNTKKDESSFLKPLSSFLFQVSSISTSASEYEEETHDTQE